MSRIQYPKREEIDVQIREILDKSEMFEEEQDISVQKFTPVHHRRSQIYKVGKIAVGIAVAAGVVIFVNRFEVVSHRGAAQPMTSVTTEDTNRSGSDVGVQEEPYFSDRYEEQPDISVYEGEIQNLEQKIQQIEEKVDALRHTEAGLSDSIDEISWLLKANGIKTGVDKTDEGLKRKAPDNARMIGENTKYITRKVMKQQWRDSLRGDKIFCTYQAQHPYIYNNDALLNGIEEYYQTIDGIMALNLLKKDFSDVAMEEDLFYQYKVEDFYLSAGMYAPNKSVVSVIQEYKESLCGYERKTDSSKTGLYIDALKKTEFRNMYMIANNFNVETGEYIGLEDIFTDAEAGKKELFTEVERQIRENYADEQLSEAYRSGQFDAENGISVIRNGFNLNQYSWYFSQNGVNICCNGLTQNVLAENPNLSSVTITVPYEKLHYLAQEYQP